MSNNDEFVQQQLARVLKVLEGNGRSGLIEDVTAQQVKIDNLISDVQSLQSKLETQTRWLISSLFATLLAVSSAIITAIVS